MHLINEDTELPSNRKFGVFFVIVFGGLAAYFVFTDRVGYGLFPAVLAALLLFITLFATDRLAPFNRAWFSLGLLLSRIVSPVVLGFLFFGLFSPVALVTRLFGRDELSLRPKMATTYWRSRKPADGVNESFRNQF